MRGIQLEQGRRTDPALVVEGPARRFTRLVESGEGPGGRSADVMLVLLLATCGGTNKV